MAEACRRVQGTVLSGSAEGKMEGTWRDKDEEWCQIGSHR